MVVTRVYHLFWTCPFLVASVVCAQPGSSRWNHWSSSLVPIPESSSPSHGNHSRSDSKDPLGLGCPPARFTKTKKKHMDQHGHQTPLIRTMPKGGQRLSESGRIDNKYFSVIPFQARILWSYQTLLQPTGLHQIKIVGWPSLISHQKMAWKKYRACTHSTGLLGSSAFRTGVHISYFLAAQQKGRHCHLRPLFMKPKLMFDSSIIWLWYLSWIHLRLYTSPTETFGSFGGDSKVCNEVSMTFEN